MTMESAPVPGTGQATAVQAPTVHPPRRSGGAARTRPGERRTVRRGTLAPLLCADALAPAVTCALVVPVSWPWPLVAVQAVAQVLLFARRGLHRPRLSPSVLSELPALLGLTLLQWYVTMEMLAAWAPQQAIGWTVLAYGAATQTALTCTGRAAVYRARRRAAVRRPLSTLVVGQGPLAGQVTTALYDHPGYGLRPVGLVAGPGYRDEQRAAGAGSVPLPVLASPQEVGRAVVQNSVRHVVFTAPPEATPDGAALFSLLTGYGCRMWLVTGPGSVAGLPAEGRRDHLWGFSVQPLRDGTDRPLGHGAKRTMDAVLATAGLLLAAPVMAGCALAVRLSDGPGVIFRQERVGRHGRPFVLLKFRTLRPADVQESATRWNVASDGRMSRVGRVLRRTSLDELPQLWNVLRGDMSMVGPRPERPYFVAQFSRAHPGYQARHRMPVGITGLAQVNGLRGDTSIEERARFDNHYIETWSLWQDACVLARTAGSLFRLGGS
ncbi:exopolysaccharide biosynthesis polyprenyl glycosylphosphotransferase [Streptomyces sp. NPDC017546]|uniref:exopolysaccharide biosynthesis polyprenyl glycosylphosphotransferase n=1 Tax=unclassified Streptomyces TaxID=2593676 RepID=UPI00236269BC|nr:exopolysaccharide biosynthesis polyprenyl glycosylphosphotransferase [Streptomyces sp. MMBL 11-1]